MIPFWITKRRKYRNGCELFGIVNNAGLMYPGPFEFVPKDMEEYQFNVLFHAPRNIVRMFLPLMKGRKNYDHCIRHGVSRTNGGRIINVCSNTVYYPSDTRYSNAKCALAYFSRALRVELSAKFGIWTVSIEPGPFATNFNNVSNNALAKIMSKHREEGRDQILDVYQEEIAMFEQLYSKDLIPGMNKNMKHGFSLVASIKKAINTIFYNNLK